MDIIELYSKPSSYKFSKEEIEFIKKKVPKNKFMIKYAFYRKKSSKEAYIALIIDSAPYSVRKSAVENNWEVICHRSMTNIEYQEEIENFGCNKRRFKVHYYNCIEKLIEDDKLYYLETPKEFVKKAIKRGYTKEIQLKLVFI